MLNNVLKLYIEHSENFSKTTIFVKHISKLVCKFDSEIVFRQLCDLCGGHWETLYNKRLMLWLKGELVLVEYCLSIIFTLMKYIKKKEKQGVLQDLSKVNYQKACVIIFVLHFKTGYFKKFLIDEYESCVTKLSPIQIINLFKSYIYIDFLYKFKIYS